VARWLETLGVFARPPDPRPRREVDDDIRVELDFHLAMATEEFVCAGLSPEAAAAEAHHRFGDRATIEKQCRKAQLGERIMLQRIQVVVLAVVAAAVVGLFVQNGRSQVRYERTLDALRTDLAAMGDRVAEKAAMVGAEQRTARAWDNGLAGVSMGSGVKMFMPRDQVEGFIDSEIRRTGAGVSVDNVRMRLVDRTENWIARLSTDDDWRIALEVGDEIARLAPAQATVALATLWPQVRSAEHKRQLLKPFVLRDLRPNALDVLDLAARDADATVQNRAFHYLRGIAFRDFVAEPAAYAAWRARVEGRPVGEVLIECARSFARGLARLDGAAIEAAMGAVDLEHVQYRGADGDVAAALRADGFLDAVCTWVDHGDEASARAATTWLSLLQPDSALLRSWLKGDTRHRGVALCVLMQASYVTSREDVRELLHSDVLDERAVGRRRIAFCNLDEKFVREELFPLLADPAQVDREILDEIVAPLGASKFPCAVEPLVHLLLASRVDRPIGSSFELRTKVADALVRIGDARAIPPLIALLAADRSIDGVWQHPLHALTGVADVPGHDPAFWRKWWTDNRPRYPADARELEIPVVEGEVR